MDNQTQNQAQEHMKKLPQAVQDFVYEGEWEVRTNEIAKKYSLSPTQTDTLSNVVVLVLIGLESPGTFLETLVTDLSVSRLLAEQIVTDLEKRVFEYAIKEIEGKQQKTISTTQTQVTPSQPKTENLSKTTFDVSFPKPVIKSTNLPMVEKGEVVHNNPLPKPNVQEQKPIPSAGAPVQISPVTSEPVQRPIPVPRFTAADSNPSEQKISTEIPIENKPIEKVISPKIAITPQSMMSNKLNSVVKSTSAPQPENPQGQAPQKPPQTYTVDPYREPIN